MSKRTRGYVFALLALTIFSFQDAISKHLGQLYPPVFVTMIRYWAFGSFTLLMALRLRRGAPDLMRSKRPWLQIVRGALLAIQVVVAITCFSFVGLARSQAIFSGTPIIVAILSIVLLREQVDWRRWAAIAAGLLGVLMIIRPDSGIFEPKVLLALAGCLLFAFYIILTRLVSRVDGPLTSFFYTGVVGALVMTLIGPFYWTAMRGADWGWMGLICLTSITSHYCLIRAYDLIEASAVQPLTYINLVYASLIGMVVFGETLSWNIILGAVIVVVAGSLSMLHDHVSARKLSS